MPRAERSLQDALEAEGSFDDLKTAETLLAIVQGLSKLPEIVHRDLKPPNVLFHAGHWKVADFGIARFVKETTSARTLKDCLSPPYAAPEQWQYLRVTGATDIYALGCTGYALLTGKPPFEAATMEDLFEKHLKADPPKLQGVTPQLDGLLTMMLRKPPESRPSRDRVRQILNTIIERGRERASVPAAYNELAAAGAHVARVVAVAERQTAQVRSEHDQRRSWGRMAEKSFKSLYENFLNALELKLRCQK